MTLGHQKTWTAVKVEVVITVVYTRVNIGIRSEVLAAVRTRPSQECVEREKSLPPAGKNLSGKEESAIVVVLTVATIVAVQVHRIKETKERKKGKLKSKMKAPANGQIEVVQHLPRLRLSTCRATVRRQQVT